MVVDDKFTELVLREAGISADRLEEALHRQVTSGSSFDLVLLEMGLLTEVEALEFLSRSSGLPRVGREEILEVDPSVVMMFPRRLAEKHGIAPLDLSGRRLSVAVHRAPDLGLLDDIGFMLSVYIRPFVTTSPRIEYALHRLYNVAISPRVENLLGMWGEVTDEKPVSDPARARRLAARLNALAVEESAAMSSTVPVAPPPSASVSPPAFERPAPENVAEVTPEPAPVEAARSVDDPMVPVAVDDSASSSAENAEVQEVSDEDSNAADGEFVVSVAPDRVSDDAGERSAPTLRRTSAFEEDGWRVVSSGAALRKAVGPDAPTRAQAESNILTSTPMEAAALDPSPDLVEQKAAEVRVNALLDAEEAKDREAEDARRQERVRWTVDDAIAELALADGRDEMVDVLLRFARRRLPTAAMFILQRDASGTARFVGWDVISDAWTRAEFRRVSIPATGVGALAKLAQMHSPFLGPLQDDDPLTDVWGRAPRASLLVPVMVGDSLAGAVYGDCGPRSIPPSSLAELHMVVPRLGKGLRNLIVRSKRRVAQEAAHDDEVETRVDDFTPAAVQLSPPPVIDLDDAVDAASDETPEVESAGGLAPAFGADDLDTGATRTLTPPATPAPLDVPSTVAPMFGGESTLAPSKAAVALGAAMGFIEPPTPSEPDDVRPEEEPPAEVSAQIQADVDALAFSPGWERHGPLMEPLRRPVDPDFVYTHSHPSGEPLEVVEAPPLPAARIEVPAFAPAAVEEPSATDESEADGSAADDVDNEHLDAHEQQSVIGFDDEEPIQLDEVVYRSVDESVSASTTTAPESRLEFGIASDESIPGDEFRPTDVEGDEDSESSDTPEVYTDLVLPERDDDDAAASDDVANDDVVNDAVASDDVASDDVASDDVANDDVANDNAETDASAHSHDRVAETASATDEGDDDDDDDWEDGEEPIDASVLQIEPPKLTPRATDEGLDHGALSIHQLVPEHHRDEALVPGGDDDSFALDDETTEAAAARDVEEDGAPQAEQEVADTPAPVATESAPLDDANWSEGRSATRPLPAPARVGRSSASDDLLTIVADDDDAPPVLIRRFTAPSVSPTEDTAPRQAAEGPPTVTLADAELDDQANQFEHEDSTGERPIITGVAIADETTESGSVAPSAPVTVTVSGIRASEIDVLDAAFRAKSEGHPVAPGPTVDDVIVPLPGAEALGQPPLSSPVPTIDDAAAAARDARIPPPLPSKRARPAAVVDDSMASIHEATTLPPGLRSCAPSPGAAARESVLLATWRNWMQHDDAEMDGLLAELQQPGEVGRSAIARLAAAGDRAMPSLARYFPGVLRVHPFGPMDARPEVREFSDALAVLDRMGADAAAPILAAEVRHDDRLHRYTAVWALSELRVPSTLPRLAERVFDSEWRIALLAIDVLQTYRQEPAFGRLLVELRKYVGKGDEFQRKRAILAVSELRDLEALPLLVDLLGTRPKSIADEARRALVDVTKQDFGSSGRRWRAWLADNGQRPRIEWLLDGLAHKDAAIREASHMELGRLTQNFFAFRHDGPRQEREASIVQWREWWANEDPANWT